MFQPSVFRLSAFAAPLLGVVLLWPGSSLAQGAPKPSKTKFATCDEIVGETQARSDAWRVFFPGTRIEGNGDRTWACRRSSRPATQVLSLGAWQETSQLAGDYVRLIPEGRYGNCASYVVHLPTLRAIPGADCDIPVARDDVLLGNGAIVSVLDQPSPGDADQPAPSTRTSGELKVLDARGTTTLAPAGATQVAEIGAGSTIVPFAGSGPASAGFYYTTVDGVLRRATTEGGADASKWPPLDRSRRIRVRPRIPRIPGRSTTYISVYEIRRQRATRGHRASLTLRRPDRETLGSTPEYSDLVLRLAPGSIGDLRIAGSIIIGRSADEPDAVRLLSPAAPRSTTPLPGAQIPADLNASTFVGGVDSGLRQGDTVSILTGPYGTKRRPAVVTLPPGARDLVTAPASPVTEHRALGRLLFTDAGGTPGSVEYSRLRD